MSASATARSLHREISSLTPAEFKERTPKPRQYTETPNAYFDTLPAKCSSLVEYAVIGMVIRRTYGGKGRPRWTDLTAATAAELLKVTIDGAENGFKAAEAHGFLEARELGRKKYYRACPEKFDAAPDKDPRKLERKPVASAAEPHSGYKAEPVLLSPGRRTKPIRLTAAVRARYRNECSRPISLVAAETKEGLVDIALREAENQELTSTPTESFQGEGLANDRRTEVGISPGLIERIELNAPLLRDGLARNLRGKLDTPPDDTAIYMATAILGPGEPDQFFRHLASRTRNKPQVTMGLVFNLAADVGMKALEEFQKKRPASAELRELEEWTARQRERVKRERES